MIGSAIERGSLICVFDEHGSTLFQKARGSGATDGLLGFTVPPSPHGMARSSTRTTKTARRIMRLCELTVAHAAEVTASLVGGPYIKYKVAWRRLSLPTLRSCPALL